MSSSTGPNDVPAPTAEDERSRVARAVHKLIDQDLTDARAKADALLSSTKHFGAATAIARLGAVLERAATEARGLADRLAPGLGDEPNTDDPPLETLTKREREVLVLLADGHTTKDAATQLELSAKTIASHRENAMKKLKISRIALLTKYAIRQGLTTTDDDRAT